MINKRENIGGVVLPRNAEFRLRPSAALDYAQRQCCALRERGMDPAAKLGSRGMPGKRLAICTSTQAFNRTLARMSAVATHARESKQLVERSHYFLVGQRHQALAGVDFDFGARGSFGFRALPIQMRSPAAR